jgi:hypothetical protein
LPLSAVQEFEKGTKLEVHEKVDFSYGQEFYTLYTKENTSQPPKKMSRNDRLTVGENSGYVYYCNIQCKLTYNLHVI